ncbi:hemerythrin domain-containing protein [Streptomyces sp. B8F3]|uniref:hemerythrin domain-containing protein n=1 Tax=Streptomyces sp. B8F3 TaxID=3153573 RepID=UPI00325D106F
MGDTAENSGARLYEEFVAIHEVLRRGTAMVADAYKALARGDEVHPGELAEAVRWLLAFTHAHHRAEDDVFWPLLHTLYPRLKSDLAELSAEHAVLDQALNDLEAATAGLSHRGGGPSPGPTGRASEAATRLQDILTGHLAAEEAVVERLFPGVPEADIIRLREAFIQGSPRFGVHLMFGLLEDPEPARGQDLLTENFPPALRDAREGLLEQYRTTREALAA